MPLVARENAQEICIEILRAFEHQYLDILGARIPMMKLMRTFCDADWSDCHRWVTIAIEELAEERRKLDERIRELRAETTND